MNVFIAHAEWGSGRWIQLRLDVRRPLRRVLDTFEIGDRGLQVRTKLYAVRLKDHRDARQTYWVRLSRKSLLDIHFTSVSRLTYLRKILPEQAASYDMIRRCKSQDDSRTKKHNASIESFDDALSLVPSAERESNDVPRANNVEHPFDQRQISVENVEHVATKPGPANEIDSYHRHHDTDGIGYDECAVSTPT